MIAVRKNEFIKFEDELSVERMELDVDTADELPEVDFLSGHRLYMGSIAWVIATGEFYGLNGDGEWINQENGEPAIASATTLQSAPMRMMSAVKPEIVEEVVEDEKSLRNTESDENRLLD